MANSKSKGKPTPLLEILNRTPPFALYYLCGLGGSKFTDRPDTRKMAERSGLSISTLGRLATCITWKGHLNHFDDFCKACEVSFIWVGKRGISLSPPHKHYLKCLARGAYRKPLRHLNDRQRKHFDQCCQRWVSANGQPSP